MLSSECSAEFWDRSSSCDAHEVIDTDGVLVWSNNIERKEVNSVLTDVGVHLVNSEFTFTSASVQRGECWIHKVRHEHVCSFITFLSNCNQK